MRPKCNALVAAGLVSMVLASATAMLAGCSSVGCAAPSVVVAPLSDAEKYYALNPYFAKAFDFLKREDLANLKPGRHEIDGTNCWAMVFDVELKPWKGEARFEAHRAYIDVQVPVSGEEIMGSMKTPLDGIGPFNDAKDYVLFNAKGGSVTVKPGEFVVFFPPCGAHAPGYTAGEQPRKHRKVVVKVRDVHAYGR